MDAIGMLNNLSQQLEKETEMTKGEINREKLIKLIKEAVKEHNQLEVEFGILREHYKKLIKYVGKNSIIEIINEDMQQQIKKMSGHWEDWIEEVEKLSI
jgi:hypothetical protein